MFVSAGHIGISCSRAGEVTVALLVPLSCDVLMSLALMSPVLTSATGPGVVGRASGSHDGLYKNSFESEIIVRHCECEHTSITTPCENLDARRGAGTCSGS
jgi:hypothetical protein